MTANTKMMTVKEQNKALSQTSVNGCFYLFYVLFKIFCKKYFLLQNKLYICIRVKEVIYTANFKTYKNGKFNKISRKKI